MLATQSSLGIDARLAISTEDGRLVFRTFIHCANRAAAAAWTGVAPIHRQIAQRLVNRAARR